jgi:hypothetical protein
MPTRVLLPWNQEASLLSKTSYFSASTSLDKYGSAAVEHEASRSSPTVDETRGQSSAALGQPSSLSWAKARLVSVAMLEGVQLLNHLQMSTNKSVLPYN